VRVRFEQVVKRFGSSIVLHGIDLDVPSGECVVLLGPSGCGKTTLLRLVAGLETPDAGRVIIGNRVVNAVPPSDRDVAMVFQNYALYPHLRVFDNIAFPLVARRVATYEIARRVKDVAARLDLTACLERRPAQLSGGQQQRVALARAIVRSPVVYLMDEPLSNLDAQLRIQTRAELKRLQQELGTTTIYVTHDQAEAMTLGQRVAILRAGRIEQFGAPLDLYRRPANRFVATFLGSPAINIWRGQIIDGAAVAAGAPFAVAPAVAGILSRSAFDVGVRPEDIRISTSAQAGWTAARVDVVEAIGNETIVFLTSGGERVVVRAGPELKAGAGAQLWFQLNGSRIHFFASGTGQRLETS
jgi:ABC-type sugar transport system ATPase subunit